MRARGCFVWSVLFLLAREHREGCIVYQYCM
jgi:hypothetical protein